MPQWVRLTDFPQTGVTTSSSGTGWGLRNKPVAAWISGKGYLTVGYSQWDTPNAQDEIYEFDPATGICTMIVDGSSAVVRCPHTHVSGGGTAVNGLFAVFGGSGSYSYLDLYNPTTKTWTTDDLPLAIRSPDQQNVAANCCLSYGNKLYSFGGTAGRTFNYQQVGWVWNPAAASGSRWSSTASWSGLGINGLVNQCGAVLGTKAYLFGGAYGGAGTPQQKFTLIYDFVANTWSRGADMPLASESEIAATLGSRIVVTIKGGTYYYTPGTDSWSSSVATTLTTNAYQTGSKNGAYASDGTYLYSFCGDGADPNNPASSAFYDGNMVVQQFTNVLTATAALSGVGSIPSVDAASIQYGEGAIGGQGTLSASSARVQSSEAALDGVGDLSATGGTFTPATGGPYVGAIITL